MEDTPISAEELSSELTGLNKGENRFNKKQIIIAGSIAAAVIILIIIIIIIASSGSDFDDVINLPVIGEINCVYEVSNEDTNTILFGNNFNKNSLFDIYINNERIKYAKEYKFDKTGNHEVQIKLYENINMDYMFEGVQDLVSVDMKSENNCQILSMISTFENCFSFTDFKIKGFKADNLKSMKKLFYRTYLTTYSFSSFDTVNLEDISYMFAASNIKDFSLKELNTHKVTDMSHLIEDCVSIISLDFSAIDTTNVKDMSYMFHGISSLKDLDLSSFKTNQVVNMSYMFQFCISLTYLNIKSFDTSKVEDMSYMFDSCFSL